MMFLEKLEARQRKANSLLCVGLDSDCEKIGEDICLFTEEVVAATYPYVCAYKPNMAFYEYKGSVGFMALEKIVMHIQEKYPDIPIILDGKRTDIGNTNKGYAHYAFDILGADAVTVNPYFGEEALQPFLERKDKGIIVLCRTSNPGAKDFQDLPVTIGSITMPLYQWVAYKVAKEWNKNGNCLLVVGATYPEELKQVRQIVGDMPILVPAVGAQGGDLEAVLRNGLRLDGLGLIINASRSIIFASSGKDFVEAAIREAKQLRDLINKHREAKP